MGNTLTGLVIVILGVSLSVLMLWLEVFYLKCHECGMRGYILDMSMSRDGFTRCKKCERIFVR